MNTAVSAVEDLARRVFSEHADPQQLLLQGDETWRSNLASVLEETGLSQAFVAEAFGGAGVSGLDVGRICVCAGESAVTYPLVELLLVHRLAAMADLKIDAATTTLAPARLNDLMCIDDDGRVCGDIHRITLSPEHQSVLVLAEHESGCQAAVLTLDDCVVHQATTVSREVRCSLRIDATTPDGLATLPSGTASAAILAGAVLRSCQMVGALRKSLELARDYALDREAFERPISKFQAVQHQLARMAGETAGLEAAALQAATHLEGVFEGSAAAWQAGVCAKIKAGSAAREGARIAHQVFGAIGFTREHVLHRYTNALLSWRDDYGSETDWARRLGNAVLQHGGDEFWPRMTAPQESFADRIRQLEAQG